MPRLILDSVRKLDLRLRHLHDCQEGGVQSLSLVMTLPLFVGTILLVIQLAQVLLGVMTTQYAAFAAARSAIVWIPADADRDYDTQNDFGVGLPRGTAVELSSQLRQSNRKIREIHAAAAQACVAISPARTINGPRASGAEVDAAVDAFLTFQQLTNDSRIDRWRAATTNRWSYAFANTYVKMTFLGQTRLSPTYNPIGHPVVSHHDDEAGWDEAVTIVVRHDVALVPGPGRLLFQNQVWGSAPGTLASNWSVPNRRDRVPVIGSATLTLAGLKSNRPIRILSHED